MILYVLDNININSDDKVFIIYYNIEKEELEKTILHLLTFQSPIYIS